MTLKVIEIKQVKGIKEKRFELDIIPNRPSLLVAPNGFGKSSLTIGFDSMNKRRINLAEDDYYELKPDKSPKIKIIYEDDNGNVEPFVANEEINTVKDKFDIYVIRSPLKAKASANFYGGASASLEIKPITIFNNIPENISFNYSVQKLRDKFGDNGKVLSNIKENVFGNLKLIYELSKHFQTIERAAGNTFIKAVENIIERINSNSGSKTQELLDWMDNELYPDMMSIRHYSKISKLLENFDLGFTNKSNNFLSAIQIIWLYHENPSNFKGACKYNNYKLEKKRLESLISDFNTTWKNIKTKETNGSLIISFPKATEISNGERDILTFISMIFKAKTKLRKNLNILIIDEIFDYLDDANLLAAQYYITKLIKDYKDDEKRIYPLILTHLNPYYFKNYAFKKQKVYFLQKTDIELSHPMKQLLKKRVNFDDELEHEVSKKLFHYHPEPINKRSEFAAIGGLRETWGERDNFRKFIDNELEKYLANNADYDPFAVCCAVRIKIEELAYKQIFEEKNQKIFLEERTTRKKLDKAEEFGIFIPETHYLLGIIYNDAMHWRENQDNVTPVATKLQNRTIKKLIKEVRDA